MRREQRRMRFRAVFTRFMERADVGDTGLARRVDVARLTVRRWREGQALPSEETIRRLKSGLHWLDSAGVTRELTEPELDELLIAAGYYRAPPPQDGETDRITPTDRCVAYTHRYASNRFPSRWSTRIIELERSLPGSIYTMWNMLPSITRSPEWYIGGYEHGVYERERVEAYMDLHAARREAFLRRLETSEVQHLYSLKGINDVLSGATEIHRPLWDFWHPPKEVLAAQFDSILAWLDFDNFEVRLRPSVPGNVIIIGLDVVLTEFSRASATKTADNITGLEIIGADAAVQFTKQFRSFWSDEETVKNRDEVIRELRTLRARYA